MNELIKDVEGVMGNDSMFADIEKCLRETAKKWSGYCCDKLDGKALTKGLMISKSIVEFINEIETENEGMDKGD